MSIFVRISDLSGSFHLEAASQLPGGGGSIDISGLTVEEVAIELQRRLGTTEKIVRMPSLQAEISAP